MSRPSGHSDPFFQTTDWSVVLAAGAAATGESHEALAALSQAYWYPIYAFARRRTPSVQDAEDATQQFFTDILSRGTIGQADPLRGRFRTYLLGAFKHFLSNQRVKARAQKRGGGRIPIRLDFVSAEARYMLEPEDQLTPERLFDRQWALTFVDHVINELRDEYVQRDKRDLFDRLKPFILSDRNRVESYTHAAAELGMTDGAIKVAATRLRERFRGKFREEIARTVASPEELEDEISRLMTALQ